MPTPKPNRARLRVVIAQHDLDNDAVAKAIGRSANTVSVYRAKSGELDIPDALIKKLERKYKNKKKR